NHFPKHDISNNFEKSMKHVRRHLNDLIDEETIKCFEEAIQLRKVELEKSFAFCKNDETAKRVAKELELHKHKDPNVSMLWYYVTDWENKIIMSCYGLVKSALEQSDDEKPLDGVLMFDGIMLRKNLVGNYNDAVEKCKEFEGVTFSNTGLNVKFEV